MIEIIIDPNNEDTARFYCGEICIASVTRIMISPNVGEYVKFDGSKYYIIISPIICIMVMLTMK